MATMEQAFEMVENLTEELTEKEERLIKLEKKIKKQQKVIETQQKQLQEFDDTIYHYCIKVSVWEFFEGCAWEAVEIGESDVCWLNCFDYGSDLRKNIASQESLDAIIAEMRHINNWRFYWGENYDLMAQKTH